MKTDNFENINVICSKSPKERIPLLTNFLYLYGIKENKNVYLQTFLLNSSYYVNQLISYISNIDFKIIESYMVPFTIKSNCLKRQKINSEDFIYALEKIRKSNIVISSTKIFEEQDWIDYIFDFNHEYQIIIVDNFADLLTKTKKSFKQIKLKIEKYSKKYNPKIILFMSEKELIKYHFSNWKISYIDKPFVFKYDKNNHIADIILKEDEV